MKILGGSGTTTAVAKPASSATTKPTAQAETNTGSRKPNSTIVLCTLAAYMVRKGYCTANIADYENAVKNMKETIRGRVLNIDSKKTFVAGDDYDDLVSAFPDKIFEVLETFEYTMPVKHNLHVNTMGKVYYGITLDEARRYKVKNEEFFIVSSEVKKDLLLKCAISTDCSHLPSNSADIESEIEDILVDFDTKVQIVSSRASGDGTPKAVKTKETDSDNTTASGRGKKMQHLGEDAITKAKIVAPIKRIAKTDSFDLNSTEYARIDVADMQRQMNLATSIVFKSVDVDPGLGHFNFTFRHTPTTTEVPFVIGNFNPLTGEIIIISQRDFTDEEMGLLVPIILITDPTGERIHDIKEGDKRALIWNKSNYLVFVAGK